MRALFSQVVPDEIMENISDQIQQVQTIPKRLDQYSEREIEEFPKLFDWSVNGVESLFCFLRVMLLLVILLRVPC